MKKFEDNQKVFVLHFDGKEYTIFRSIYCKNSTKHHGKSFPLINDYPRKFFLLPNKRLFHLIYLTKSLENLEIVALIEDEYIFSTYEEAKTLLIFFDILE